MNNFEYAIRKGFRYASMIGVLHTEQLFDLPLASEKTASLNSVAKGLNKLIKEHGEEDFINAGNNTARELLERKLEVVKAVILIKQDAEKARAAAAKNAQIRQQLLGIKADRQKDAITKLTDDEIEAKLAELS